MIVFDRARTIAGGSVGTHPDFFCRALCSAPWGALLRPGLGPAVYPTDALGRPSTTGGVGGQSVAGCKYRVRGQRGGSCFEDFCLDFSTVLQPSWLGGVLARLGQFSGPKETTKQARRGNLRLFHSASRNDPGGVRAGGEIDGFFAQLAGSRPD